MEAPLEAFRDKKQVKCCSTKDLISFNQFTKKSIMLMYNH